jgi:hypothetical protein
MRSDPQNLSRLFAVAHSAKADFALEAGMTLKVKYIGEFEAKHKQASGESGDLAGQLMEKLR